ncbi:hypothetical protein CVT25_002989 [Psilocybe cyanescens]|uniref:Uncharacterized protein n=1 Tax=Psilocybe cyanescens TaxID=93625 RepID=A0A409WMW0_PSICY|nr:hypothetical protein CVT25_002989 [Psilocybe cyanescens]
MIAKFHSAPGHSMETTLKFNLPPMQGGKLIRVDKEKEGVRDAAVEKELKAEERREKRQRKKEEQERAKELARQQDMEVDSVKQVENDRDKDSQVREQGSLRVHTERAGSYKDKFQRMREKYDKVTAAHETGQRDLELLNAKIKKLQAENELLLDAMLSAETDLYERYFDRSASSSPVLDPTLPTPPLQTSQNHSQAPTPRSTQYREPPLPQSGGSASIAGPMAPPSSGVSSTSTGGPPGSAGLRPMPPPLPPMPPTPASSNGTVVSNGTNALNSMPPPSSTASSNGTAASSFRMGVTRWTTQASPFVLGAHSSGRRSSVDAGSLPLTPEEVTTNGDGPRADARTPAPMAVDAPQEGDEPVRTPRINGNSSPAVTPHSEAVNGNGVDSRLQIDASREITPLRENHKVEDEDDVRLNHFDAFMDLEGDDYVGPAPPGPEAGAGVHSPIVHSPIDYGEGFSDEDDDKPFLGPDGELRYKIT